MKSSAQESKSGDGAMLEFDFLSSKEAEKFRKNQRSWTKLKIGGKKFKIEGKIEIGGKWRIGKNEKFGEKQNIGEKIENREKKIENWSIDQLKENRMENHQS